MARNTKPLLRRTIGKSEPSHLALTEVLQARPTACAYCLSSDLLFLHLGMISLRAAGGFVHRPNQTKFAGDPSWPLLTRSRQCSAVRCVGLCSRRPCSWHPLVSSVGVCSKTRTHVCRASELFFFSLGSSRNTRLAIWKHFAEKQRCYDVVGLERKVAPNTK